MKACLRDKTGVKDDEDLGLCFHSVHTCDCQEEGQQTQLVEKTHVFVEDYTRRGSSPTKQDFRKITLPVCDAISGKFRS